MGSNYVDTFNYGRSAEGRDAYFYCGDGVVPPKMLILLAHWRSLART
jgi:hypothetical protein